MLKYFYDDYWGELTGLGFTLVTTCIIVLVVALMFVGGNSYTKWQCNNYKEVTGFEVKYIDFDACYIKGSDGVFVRYDSKYKNIN